MFCQVFLLVCNLKIFDFQAYYWAMTTCVLYIGTCLLRDVGSVVRGEAVAAGDEEDEALRVGGIVKRFARVRSAVESLLR
jgi:hypothetical protein